MGIEKVVAMSKPPAVVGTGGRALAPAAGLREVAAPVLLEYQSPTAALIASPVPWASRVPGRAIVALVVAVLAVLAMVPVDRVVVASGKVAATSGNLMVQPLEVSLVRSIDVKEGQLVKAGDVLAELDPTFAGADAGTLEQQVASLQAEVNRLTAETENRVYLSDGTTAGQLQETLFTQRHAMVTYTLENYDQQIASLRVKMEQSAQDVKSFTARLQLAQEVEAKRRELERMKVGSQLNLLQATDTRVNIAAQLEAARLSEQGSRRDMEAQIAARDAFLKKTASETAQKLTEQGRKLDDDREQLAKASLRRNLVKLRAGRDAIVLRVAPVSVGTVMQSGDPFIELVPLDAPLQINAVVDGENIGFVQVGDPVTIKFDTFMYQVYGTAAGTVRAVSPDSFTDPNASAPTSGTLANKAMGVLFFPATMSIDAVQLHDLPAGARIVPGMPVEADIRVDKITVLRYLLSLVIPATTEGMREP